MGELLHVCMYMIGYHRVPIKNACSGLIYSCLYATVNNAERSQAYITANNESIT